MIWFHLRILREKERERRWFTHVVHEITSQKVFKWLYKLFNEAIWIVTHLQHYNYFTCAGQRIRRWRCRCISCQTSHGRRIISLRSVFWDRPLEAADQTSQSDYRPIVIDSRSIGAPLKKSNKATRLHCFTFIWAIWSCSQLYRFIWFSSSSSLVFTYWS